MKKTLVLAIVASLLLISSADVPDSDINDNGKVNIEDFAVLATWWDDENTCSLPD